MLSVCTCCPTWSCLLCLHFHTEQKQNKKQFEQKQFRTVVHSLLYSVRVYLGLFILGNYNNLYGIIRRQLAQIQCCQTTVNSRGQHPSPPFFVFWPHIHGGLVRAQRVTRGTLLMKNVISSWFSKTWVTWCGFSAPLLGLLYFFIYFWGPKRRYHGKRVGRIERFVLWLSWWASGAAVVWDFSSTERGKKRCSRRPRGEECHVTPTRLHGRSVKMAAAG